MMSREEKIKEMLERLDIACGMYQYLIIQELHQLIQ